MTADSRERDHQRPSDPVEPQTGDDLAALQSPSAVGATEVTPGVLVDFRRYRLPLAAATASSPAGTGLWRLTHLYTASSLTLIMAKVELKGEYRMTGPRVPSLAEVATVFQKHLGCYSTSLGEQARVLRNSEASVKLQYSGRVAFELLQNALDRAEKRVWITLVDDEGGSTLIVANDGAPVTLDPDFDYDDSTPVEGRADLNALLSLHTSNKSADESMGNKGIGFRSVFGVGDRVQVWSRCENNEDWWGVEMHWPAHRITWLKRVDEYEPARKAVERCWGNLAPAIVTGLDSANRASFALPLPLLSKCQPELKDPSVWPSRDNLVTAVVIPIRVDVRKDVLHHLEELRASRLHFVGLRPNRRSIQVTVNMGGKMGAPLRTWEADDWSVLHWRSEALKDLAKSAEHVVSKPGVALAWPPYRRPGGESREGPEYETLVFNYLPTRMRSDLYVDLHGDFQVKADRTSMDLEDNAVGRYNQTLIKAAADLHLWAVLGCLGMQNDTSVAWPWSQIHTYPSTIPTTLSFRDDLWCLLIHRDGGFGELSKALSQLLFDHGKPGEQAAYTRWAKLAHAFFGHQHARGEDGRPCLPVQVYREFWDASAKWLVWLTGYGSHRLTWRQAAIALCDALRNANVPCLPLTDSIDLLPTERVRAIPLPERLAKGYTARAAYRVFLRRAEQKTLPLPTALLKNNRAITAFPLNQFDQPNISDFRPTGVTEFGRWDVFKELRQLPNNIQNFSIAPLDPEPNEAVKQQQELIRLAADLFKIPLGTVQKSPSEQPDAFGLAWRANPLALHSDDACDAGRAVATLFLPMQGQEGRWAPARQLHRGQVDTDAMGSLPEGLNLDAFLTFLGVALAPPQGETPILLVERGTDGLIEPLGFPPSLHAAGQGIVGKIGLALDQQTRDHPQRLAPAIREAWSHGLAQLILAEQALTDDAGSRAGPATEVAGELQRLNWVPVGPTHWVSAPEGIEDVHSVCPEQVVTQPGTDRRAVVTYRLRNPDEQVCKILETLGAVPALSSDHLRNPLVILKKLRDSYPDLASTTLPPNRLRNILDLAQETINALMRHSTADGEHPPIPVHDATDKPEPLNARPVRWVSDPGGAGWIAPNAPQKEIVRRFFFDLPLASVTIGSEHIRQNTHLRARAVCATEQVKGGEQPAGDDVVAVRLAQQIFVALPGLLALAQASRVMMPNIEDVRRRWGSTQTGPLLHVRDAWKQIILTEGPGVEPKEDLRGSRGHVLLLTTQSPVSGDDGLIGAKILFDLEDNDAAPPLADFGNALAELLVSKALGSLFARALATRGEEGDASTTWRRLLEREGAEPLVAGYAAGLAPLTPDEELAFRNQVKEVLRTASARLCRENAGIDQLRRLRREDLCPDVGEDWSGGVTASTITTALNDADWGDRERLFRPVLTVEADNALVWRNWLGEADRGRRLNEYALYQIRRHGCPEEQPNELDKRRQEWLALNNFPRLDLDFANPDVCWLVASEWLTHELRHASDIADDIAPGRIEDTLRTFAPHYKQVKDWIVAVTAAGWDVRQTAHSNPSKAEYAPGTQADYDEANAMRSAIGGEAEHAMLHLIAGNTHRVLRKALDAGTVDNAWYALTAAVPSSGKTYLAIRDARSQWTKAQDPGCLEQALHVSRIWGNAGFDLLGLEEDTQTPNKPIAVRYEIKGLPDGEGDVFIHLSNNERNVASRVHGAKPGNVDDTRYQGKWKLIAVEPAGGAGSRAVDLTSLVQDLIARPEDILGKLQAQGMMPDGLLLRVNRRSGLQQVHPVGRVQDANAGRSPS